MVPAVTYGLKVATLTQRNRLSLQHMERYIVLRLRQLSRDPPPTTDIFRLLNGRTINRVCRVQRLRYWGHIMRRPHSHVLKKALNYRAPGKLKRGRPCFTWRTSLERDVRLSRVHDWDQTLHDAAAHNSKCNTVFDTSEPDGSD